MAKLTDKDLYEFIYRADTLKKISIAQRWLREHPKVTSPHVLDDLLHTLDMRSRWIFNQLINEHEKRIASAPKRSYISQTDRNDNVYIIDISSGEVISE